MLTGQPDNLSLHSAGEFFFFFFWASCSNYCLAALDLGADVEQLIDCLIVQKRQAVQSMRSSTDWTLEDNMVAVLFCATLTGRRGSYTPFVQTGAERPTPVRKRWSRIQALLGRVTLRVGAGVGDENAESCRVVHPLRILVNYID